MTWQKHLSRSSKSALLTRKNWQRLLRSSLQKICGLTALMRTAASSNAKLLRIHDALEDAKKRFGSRAKLIAAVVTAEERKDAGYSARLEKYPLPRLLDMLAAAEKRAKATSKKTTTAKPAAAKPAAAKPAAAKAAVKKAPAKK
jgi:septal ring-binding cell division protein DamX